MNSKYTHHLSISAPRTTSVKPTPMFHFAWREQAGDNWNVVQARDPYEGVRISEGAIEVYLVEPALKHEHEIHDIYDARTRERYRHAKLPEVPYDITNDRLFPRYTLAHAHALCAQHGLTYTL